MKRLKVCKCLRPKSEEKVVRKKTNVNREWQENDAHVFEESHRVLVLRIELVTASRKVARRPHEKRQQSSSFEFLRDSDNSQYRQRQR
jgi:hypothetical protein